MAIAFLGFSMASNDARGLETSKLFVFEFGTPLKVTRLRIFFILVPFLKLDFTNEDFLAGFEVILEVIVLAIVLVPIVACSICSRYVWTQNIVLLFEIFLFPNSDCAQEWKKNWVLYQVWIHAENHVELGGDTEQCIPGRPPWYRSNRAHYEKADVVLEKSLWLNISSNLLWP